MASVSLGITLPAIGTAGRETDRETSGLEQSKALERFLAGVERRAYRIARIAVRSDDDALDIVQDAMIRLARSYGARPTEEWKPLFYRILNNGIRDFMRRRRVRSRVIAWWPGSGSAAPDDFDPIEAAPDPAGGPHELLEGDQALEIIEAGLAALPGRQREAFLLRVLEGLDVADTAIAMGCSEGSVKTHYFRAVQALKGRLGER
jgi:RNA polymerase sigma-70 factor (ECF subfamily)